jgi:hypothetical protein
MGRWAILNGVLVLIVLLLGLQIARTWGRTLPSVEVATRPDPAPKPEGKPDGKPGGTRRGGKRGAPERAEQQPAVLVATIVNKDLFDPSRQKASEEVKAAPVKEIGPPPNLTLVGVRMIGRDGEVLVTDAAQANQQRRLRIGDQVGGYTLKTVSPSRVEMASATGDTITLLLAVEKSSGGMPKTPGVAVPPRPGQPAGVPPSPAAGIKPPAAGVAVPPRPGQPAGIPPSPAAGIQPPAAGVAVPGAAQPRVPRAPMPAARGANYPPPPGTPPVPQPPAAGAGGAPPVPPPAISNPNLPAAVREKLEQLKGN